GPVDPPTEEQPVLAAPGAGKATIAIRVPDGTCNGAIAVGSFDWTPSNKAFPFTKVSGTESWYQITLTWDADLVVKVIALTEDGTADWGTQWGMNEAGKDPNVALLEGDAALDDSENGGEVKLVAIPDNSVTYIDVKAWKSAPCVERNKAGQASFTLTTSGLPEGASVGVVGNFPGEGREWNIADPYVLTLSNGKYTATIEVRAAQEYKYVWKRADGEWSWDTCEDGGNRQMPLDLKANDEVTVWKGLE
ncbi:MAG: hypothetical protein LBN18_07555, partial [Dysgonamonadaceae bacterium]|nr:hypothetical protein [Dysgonamonadaceae bacterium]